MKTLLLISAILLINGCDEPDLDMKPPPKKQVCEFPELPTYKIPPPKHMTEPVDLGNGLFAVVGSELNGCLIANKIMRKRCGDYAHVNRKTNEKYQTKPGEAI